MPNISCKNCALSNLCLPFSLNKQQVEELDQKIKRRKPIKRSEALYRNHEKFTTLFVVRSGAFKSVINYETREQITNFFFAGEIVGLEGIANQQYITTTTALVDSFVCEISAEDLTQFTRKFPSVQQQALQMMSQEIVHNTQAYFHGEATDKLLHFLLHLSKRFQRYGYSSKQFQLPMAKQEIANYLGLASETISRIFTKLQYDNLIEIDNRYITIKEAQHG
ncbi:MAG: hypothetical protein A3E87_00550 [Gammaproteobacteria bacterium RIFCSPHIGHO2_12_FULL_35_23]|nr:MAG: hypothetical protein A3E87_00550 [Gammaproteobacteria bacterium RIFCSPHIGHO2_12_FULL_35_23]